METFEHPFYDIDIESIAGGVLVKILSIDGRRFTYELRAPLTPEAVDYIKSLIDAVVFNDLVIEPSAAGFDARQSPIRLQKHS